MCGICGILNFDRHQAVERSTLKAMNHQIVHRGPDEDGFYVGGTIGLAMRRLSIIDVKSGHQPVTNEDGTVVLVFNGEIYNHQALRPGLEAKGHHYRSRSDSETIVHAYEEYGRDCVGHLRGMFAFAIWDSRKRLFFAARDRLGIKPFYYRRTPANFIFASEIKAILAHPGVRAELNRSTLPEYLAFGYLAGTETFYDGISKLLPGHTLEIGESGEVKIEEYWDLSPSQNHSSHPKSFYVDGYRNLLEECVSSHLMSDVPLGVFLSGGLDSSVVAALMTKIRREPIESFSVGYAEASYSELPYARIVADHLKSVHHEVLVSREDFFGALPKLIWHEDEPVVWPSSVALFFVSRLARERVKVVLTGEGSDETLAGYSRYAFTRWNSRLDGVYRGLVPGGLRKSIRNAVASSGILNAGLRRRLQHTFLARDGASWDSFYFDNFYAAFSEAEQAALLTEALRPAPGAAYRDSLAYWEKSSGDFISRLLYADIKTYLVELLMKQDNMSMAASIESRVPFLDHVLVEFAASIPSQYKIHGLAGKHILKEAVEDLLPASIVYRTKMGFPTPWRGWLAGAQLDEIERMLLESRSMERGLFKPDAVRRLFAEHRAHSKDHYDRIWRLLNLELWHRVIVDGDPAILDHTTKELSEETNAI